MQHTSKYTSGTKTGNQECYIDEQDKLDQAISESTALGGDKEKNNDKIWQEEARQNRD